MLLIDRNGDIYTTFKKELQRPKSDKINEIFMKSTTCPPPNVIHPIAATHPPKLTHSPSALTNPPTSRHPHTRWSRLPVLSRLVSDIKVRAFASLYLHACPHVCLHFYRHLPVCLCGFCFHVCMFVWRLSVWVCMSVCICSACSCMLVLACGYVYSGWA